MRKYKRVIESSRAQKMTSSVRRRHEGINSVYQVYIQVSYKRTDKDRIRKTYTSIIWHKTNTGWQTKAAIANAENIVDTVNGIQIATMSPSKEAFNAATSIHSSTIKSDNRQAVILHSKLRFIGVGTGWVWQGSGCLKSQRSRSVFVVRVLSLQSRYPWAPSLPSPAQASAGVCLPDIFQSVIAPSSLRHRATLCCISRNKLTESGFLDATVTQAAPASRAWFHRFGCAVSKAAVASHLWYFIFVWVRLPKPA
jgi:hypothetical protein